MEDWPLDWWDQPIPLHRTRHMGTAGPIIPAATSSRSAHPRGSPEPVALCDVPVPGLWARFAACRGMAPGDGSSPHPFFPHRGQDQTGPMTVCASCTVQVPCREYAAAIGPTLQGIFGLTNERQRRQRRRRPAS